MRSILSRAVLAAACAALPASVAAGQTVTLFGQQYTVQRFDYSQEVFWPNVAFPGDPPIRLFESEGVHYVGNNRLVMTADDIDDIYIGNPGNWYVEVELLVSGGVVTGLAYSRTIAAIDDGTAGYDPNPGGVTINTGPGGFGASDLVVCSTAGYLYAYSLDTGNLGQLLDQTGAPCAGTPFSCALDMTASNTNAEDAAFVPGHGGGPDMFFVVNQGTGVERWTVGGTLLGTFGVGGAADPGLNLAVPKGIAYARPTPAIPASIRRPEGTILVSFDRNFPGLQAFDVDGNLLATEYISVNPGSPLPPWRLDMTGCTSRPHIESIAVDADTGRIFLVNQGSFLECNYMWILTPVLPTCPADYDGNGQVQVADIFAFLAAWFAGEPAAFEFGGTPGVPAIFAFLAAWFAGCPS